MKTYWDILKKKTAEGKPGYPFSVGWQFLRTWAGAAVGRPLAGPIEANLITTYSCNLRCAMCDMPGVGEAARKAGSPELDTREMEEVIDGFARLGVRGLGFTGGEPLLRPDLFRLMRRARDRGIVASLNTNGLLLDEGRTEELLASGAESVNVSLYGGSLEAAAEAVRRVLRARERSGARLWVKLALVVSPGNLEEVDRALGLGAALGVDSLNLLPRQPFLEGPGNLPAPGPDPLRRVRELVARLRGPLPVRLEDSPRMLALFPGALAGRPSPIRCLAGYNSITVDCFGRVFPCLAWANWGRPRGDLRKAPLPGLWWSKEWSAVRREISGCRACTLNCHAELNLPFQPFRRIR